MNPKRLIVALVLASLVCSSGMAGQNIIKNPEEPLSTNAGRILPLKELMPITDANGKFYFRQPGDLRISADGSIFYSDWDEFLYKFDAKGNFLRNLAKKGEGPGEVRDFGGFLLEGDEIILHDTMSNKLITMDLDGNLIDEFGLGQKRFAKLIAYYGDRYWLVDYFRKEFERRSGLKEIGHDLYAVSRTGGIIKTLIALPTMESWYFGEKFSSTGPINVIQKAGGESRFLYLNNTQDYLIKLLDLEKIEIVRMFQKTYRPVKFEPPARERRFYRERGFPDRHNDIQKLLVCSDRLWVLTSTIEKDKGILTDVFDREGKYLDNFYLPLPRLKRNWVGFPPMAVQGSFLYVVEWDEGGNIFIVQYEIGENG
jgi:hypothetical protein